MSVEKKAGFVGLAMIVFGLWMGPAILPGVFLGIVSTIAMLMTYYALPNSLQSFLLIKPIRITVDLTLAFVVPFWFGNLTALAVVGSAVNSILFSIVMEYEAEKAEKAKHANKSIQTPVMALQANPEPAIRIAEAINWDSPNYRRVFVR